MNNVVEGTTINLKQKFLDSFEDPVYPGSSNSGPTVTLFDDDANESVIYQSHATPTTIPGEWEINVSVPYMDLIDEKNLKIVWLLLDDEFNSHRLESYVTVLPAQENRISDIVVLKRPSDTKLSFVLPIRYRPGDTVLLDASLNNIPIFEALDLVNTVGVGFVPTATQVAVSIPAAFDTNVMRLEPVAITCEHTDPRRPVPKYVTNNLWVITQQVGVAINMVENFLDKARLENVIPGLQYSTGDIVQYLFRGLQTFNQFPPHITAFTGMNMQGMLLECWVTLACKAALSAQLLAEGAHAFDFAGQTVNLNVDRTPSIESAIGRLDTEIENQVKPYKKLLTKAGVNGGDGSVGARAVSVGSNFGKVSILNSPTSKLGRGPGGWLRSPLRTSGRS